MGMETSSTASTPDTRFELRLLGRPRVLVDGEERSVSGLKLLLLLARLARSRDQTATREQLALFLWPGSSPENARASLRQALARLRAALSTDVDPFEVEQGRISLAHAIWRTDLDDAGAEDADLRVDGGFLDGVQPQEPELQEWVEQERRSVAVWAQKRLRQSVLSLAARRRAEDAIPLALRLVRLDPLDEDACRLLMQLFADTGKRQQALQQFERLKETLDAEIGTVPELETRALAEKLRRKVPTAPKRTAITHPVPDPEPSDALSPSASIEPALAEPAAGVSPRPKVVAAVAGFITSLCMGFLIWSVVGSPPWDKPTGAERPPAIPSIAVLPFQNIGSNPDETYFAHGITEDLIADLSRVSGMFVISRTSSFALGDGATGIEEIARQLGVAYVLEGSVRRSDGALRVTSTLTNVASGAAIWGEKYDSEAEAVFDLQDRIVSDIVAALSVELTEAEVEQLSRNPTDVPDAYDAFLKGWAFYVRQTRDDLRLALDHFDEAIRLDPDYGQAHAAIAATYWQITRRFWHGYFGMNSFARAQVHAENKLAIALPYETALAHQVAASMYAQMGRLDDALAAGRRAIGIDPNNADSFVALASALSLAGQPSEAKDLVARAMRLNPFYPSWYLYELGMAEFGLENYASAAAALERALALNAEDRWSSRLLIATYGHLGRIEDAGALANALPGSWHNSDPLTVRAISYWYPFEEDADRKRLVAGLRAAKLPE